MIHVPASVRITAESFGNPHSINDNSFLGYRFDFIDTSGKYVKSILYHGGIYTKNCNVALPWAKGGQADTIHTTTIKNATIDIAKLGPANFSGKLRLTFILQNTGRNSGVKFSVFKNSPQLIRYKE